MKIETVKGDGGSRKVDAPTLGELREEVAALCESMQSGNYYSEAADTRFCVWDGQHEDGLKHADRYTDVIEPFDGAIDARVRDVDLVINDEVELLVHSVLNARLTVTDPDGENAAGAARMQSAMRYYLKRKIGDRWMRELRRCANFMLGDSPGVGFLAINWVYEEATAYAELTLNDLRTRFIEQVLRLRMEQGGSEEEILMELQAAADAFSVAVFDPETAEETLHALIAQMFPDLRPGRVGKMAKALLRQARAGEENPVVDFPETHVRRDEPEIRALRLGEDIFLPTDVRDFEEAPYYFTVHNLTRTQVEARARDEKWSDSFKRKVIDAEDGQKGRFAFRRYTRDKLGNMRTADDEYAAHRYQVITAVYRASNDDGVPGVYYLNFHHNIDEPAHEQRLINYRHGKFPVVAFAREYISNSLIDSRGVADVWGAQQNQRKKLQDAGSNNALLGGVPPVLSINRRGGSRLWLKPFKEISLRRDGAVKYMDPPRYPTQVRDMYEQIGTDRDAYFGRRNEKLPDRFADLHEQFAVQAFVSGIREALVHLMQLVQQFADDATLERISGQAGAMTRSREEIMGQFDLELKFNPRWLDTDYLKAYGEIVKGMVVVLDRDKTIDTAPIAQQIMYGLDPDLAPSIIRDVDSANADEVRDEQDIYARIAAGIEPEMDEDPDAKNYALRLQWLQNQLESSPAWQQWPDVSRAILQAHLENYQQMTAQQENARIGRAGAQSVTGMV